MAFDPYDVLDVPRDADTGAIHKAYRRKSKKAHPDMGGNAEEFATIKRATDLLSDPIRRARYDSTGDASETQADNRYAQIANAVVQLLDAAIQQIIGMNGDPTQVDLVYIMRTTAEGKQRALAQQRTQLLADRKMGQNIANRFKRKAQKAETPDIVAGLLWAKIVGIDESITEVDLQTKIGEDVLAMLAEYSFKAEKAKANFGQFSPMRFVSAGRLG